MTSPCVSLRLEKLKRLTLHCMTLRFGKENPFPKLQYLNAKGLPGTWIKNLEKLKKLQDVNLSQCEIYDVSMLKGLPLKVLEIQDNMIEDITPICQNKSLEYLSLSGNLVEDIAPMGGLKNLQVLHLDDTWVEDISPLMKLDRFCYRVTLLLPGANSVSKRTQAVCKCTCGRGGRFVICAVYLD